MALHDHWERLSMSDRTAFLARRAAAGRWPYGAQEGWQRGRPWQPMRPLVIAHRDYEALGGVAERLLRLAVDSCRRRATTVGELREVMHDRCPQRLLTPAGPLEHDEVLRVARPDVLVCQGVPKFLELNISATIYGIPALDRMAEAYARLWAGAALTVPAPILAARSALLAALMSRRSGPGRRLLVPTWRSGFGQAAKLGNRRALRAYLRPTVESATSAGLDVVVEDLSRLRTDGHGRLYAGNARVDMVLNWFHTWMITGDSGGVEAIATALAAGTVELFLPESMRLLRSKQVLAWLYEDLDLLSAEDRSLVLSHVPWTAWAGPRQPCEDRDAVVRRALRERENLVLKPANEGSGRGVVFGTDLDDHSWRTLVTESARQQTVVVQQRVESDSVWMPFPDPSSGAQCDLRLPYVLSPFLVGGRNCGALVRHAGPDRTGSRVINLGAGAVANTTLLTERTPDHGPSATRRR
ncbi:hypothetical protein [Streptomyces sp. NBC_00162]|uniref:hypothetical protein n=1 Tax=Streptomyces sp. NBC_00162 TaxID=2903629 RepID=UPI00214B8C8D|nr:hypothetical protein [Streptomyces sp. NBC_00162]UUU43909.1 hypothetical protein JIW86_36915 [Streptomyces sp. NBC_00162]